MVFSKLFFLLLVFRSFLLVIQAFVLCTLQKNKIYVYFLKVRAFVV